MVAHMHSVAGLAASPCLCLLPVEESQWQPIKWMKFLHTDYWMTMFLGEEKVEKSKFSSILITLQGI